MTLILFIMKMNLNPNINLNTFKDLQARDTMRILKIITITLTTRIKITVGTMTIHTVIMTIHTVIMTIHTVVMTIHTVVMTIHTVIMTIHTVIMTIHTVIMTTDTTSRTKGLIITCTVTDPINQLAITKAITTKVVNQKETITKSLLATTMTK
eukprot:NODE_447_length_8464_cov_0.381112.p7 type:complete len:153 gc:universal NODE_447_length_8464_cov_0.381112:6484-6942(+)